MAEPKFVPKPGQVDYTNIRYAPVINVVVEHEGRVLLVQRSPDMHLYPSYWNGVSGFLDDAHSIEEKTTQELFEEIGVAAKQIRSIERGSVILQEAPKYNKTWLVVPVLARIDTMEFKLDWEAITARWFAPSEVHKLQLWPGFEQVLGQFLSVL